MKVHRWQGGMSIPGILAILIMVGFFAMCAIRMAPPYFEYLSVRDIVSRTAVDPEMENDSIGQIRRHFENVFNTNQITGLNARAIEIYRKKGNTYIDAGYEVRVPLVWRIDGVMKFDDLLYRMGEAEPVSEEAAPQ
ncbi:MAG: DUF4845 domain-containing protein [Pseudomonadota bacterium]